MLAIILCGWSAFMTGYIVYRRRKKPTDKVVYYDLSDYEVKYKRINTRNNERAKGF